MTMTVAKAAFPLTLTPQGTKRIGEYMAVAIADNRTIAQWDKDVSLDFRFDDADSQHAQSVGYSYKFLLSITDNLQNTDSLFMLPATTLEDVETKPGEWTLSMKFFSTSVARNYETVEPISFMVYDEIELTASATNATYGQGDGVLKVTAPAGVVLEGNVTFDVTRDGDPFEVSDANHASLTIEGNTATFTARDAGTYVLTPRMTDSATVGVKPSSDLTVTVAKAPFPISLTMPEGQPYVIGSDFWVAVTLNGAAKWDEELRITSEWYDAEGEMVYQHVYSYDSLEQDPSLPLSLSATRWDKEPSVPGKWTIRMTVGRIGVSGVTDNYEEAEPITFSVSKEVELTAVAQSTGDVLQDGDYLKPGETIVFAADVPGGLSAYADVKVLQNGSEPVEWPINSDAEGNVYITFPEMNGYAIEFTPKDSDYIYTLSPSAMYVNVIDRKDIAVNVKSYQADNNMPGCLILVSLDAASEISEDEFISLVEEDKLFPVVTCDGEQLYSGMLTYTYSLDTQGNHVFIKLYALGSYDITMELDGEAERDYALTVESLKGYPVEPTPPLVEISTDAGTYAPGSQIAVTASRVNVGTDLDSYGYLLTSRGDVFEYVDVWAENEAGQKTNVARYDAAASDDSLFLNSRPKLTLTLPDDAHSGRWTVHAKYYVSNDS